MHSPEKDITKIETDLKLFTCKAQHAGQTNEEVVRMA